MSASKGGQNQYPTIPRPALPRAHPPSATSPIDEKTIYARLGLMDPVLFELAALRRNVSEEMVSKIGPAKARERLFCGTGRTTQSLVRAVVALSHGRAVAIDADTSQRKEELRRMLREMADNVVCAPMIFLVPRDPSGWRVPDDTFFLIEHERGV